MVKTPYNQERIVALFSLYLNSGIKKQSLTQITLKNYRSDARHFLGWFFFHTKKTSIELLTHEDLEAYKKYLIQSTCPAKTLNRRLSTMRKFCLFCVSRELLIHDPSKGIHNVPLKPRERDIKHIVEILKKDSLEKRNLHHTYIQDIEEFIAYCV